jgi:hypothetical protein
MLLISTEKNIFYTSGCRTKEKSIHRRRRGRHMSAGSGQINRFPAAAAGAAGSRADHRRRGDASAHPGRPAPADRVLADRCSAGGGRQADPGKGGTAV